MMKLKKIVKILISIPKSIIVNYKSLPLNQAFRLPVLVAYDTKILSLKGKFIIHDSSFGSVRIGFSGAGSASAMRSVIENNGIMVFQGMTSMGGGSKLCTINEKSSIVFGENTHFMGDTIITASEKITFGSNCLISWRTQFIDTDFHKIFIDGGDSEKYINHDASITIAENVWIASNVNILKGVTIPAYVVIASGSTISKSIEYENCIVSGMPIRVLKKDVYWKA